MIMILYYNFYNGPYNELDEPIYDGEDFEYEHDITNDDIADYLEYELGCDFDKEKLKKLINYCEDMFYNEFEDDNDFIDFLHNKYEEKAKLNYYYEM